MKRRIVIVITILGIVLAGTFIVRRSMTSTMFSIGEKLPPLTTYQVAGSEALAEYNGEIITVDMVEYQLYIDSVRPEETRLNYSRSDVIDNLLLGFIISDEACNAGISVGREEILNSLALSKEAVEQNYQTVVEIQDFCNGANITVDKYWEHVEDQLYDTLLQLKYENMFIDDYFSSHPNAEIDEAKDAYQQHRQELLQMHQSEIIYYGN